MDRNIHLSPTMEACSVGDSVMRVGERYLVSFFVEIEAFLPEGDDIQVITDAGVFSIEDFIVSSDEDSLTIFDEDS